MATLWLKFAEDTNLPATLDDAAQAKLAALFHDRDPHSAWNHAAQMLGIKIKPASDGMIRFHKGAAYINWSHMVGGITQGWVVPVASGDSFDYRANYRIMALPALVAAQWKIAQFVNDRTADGKPLPESNNEQIAESIALGLAVLALTLRLPPHDQKTLARWLAQLETCRPSLRTTLQQIQAVQKRRTELSAAWTALFPPDASAADITLPACFWNEPPAAAQPAPAASAVTAKLWRGLFVSGSQTQGRVRIITPKTDVTTFGKTEDPLVLVFAQARPDSVNLFPHAVAVLYAEGGLMSHACTVAREKNMPCITGLGPNFYTAIQKLEGNWVSVVPESGEVSLIEAT